MKPLIGITAAAALSVMITSCTTPRGTQNQAANEPQASGAPAMNSGKESGSISSGMPSKPALHSEAEPPRMQK